MSGLLLTGLAGVAEIVARGEPLPAFRPALPFARLPLAFGTRLPTIPSATPYLSAEAQSLTNWKNVSSRRVVEGSGSPGQAARRRGIDR
jgi:hypothetical protein